METRTKNSTRNIIFSVITYMIQIILGFLARRYFIYFFNEEYLGLGSLFSNVLSILSLAELGFGTAIVFAMYKPMAENDEEKIKQLLQFYKKCYFIIGIVVLSIGVCVLPFMNFFKAKAPSVDANLYIVYCIFLFNSVISYFFAHRRSLLYTAQRNDIESKVNILTNILLTGLQLIAICFVKNYYLYIAFIGIINIINNIFIFVITQKLFPNYVKKPQTKIDKESVKKINKNIFAMVFHKMGAAIVFGTDSLLIYFLLDGSSLLGKYSNYLLITSTISTFIAIFLGAIRGSVGNSVASENIQKNNLLFQKLNFIYMWIVSFCTIAIFALSNGFIDTVLTKNSETNLLLGGNILLLISISFYCSQSRFMVNVFKECAGLFYQDRLKPIFESIINLVASIILARYIGLAGIILGTIISNIFVCIWVEPYVLNKHYLKQSTLKYCLKYIFYSVVLLLAGAITYLVCDLIPNGTIWLLIAKFATCAVVPNIVLLLCLCWLPEFKSVVIWLKEILSNLKKKEQ